MTSDSFLLPLDQVVLLFEYICSSLNCLTQRSRVHTLNVLLSSLTVGKNYLKLGNKAKSWAIYPFKVILGNYLNVVTQDCFNFLAECICLTLLFIV